MSKGRVRIPKVVFEELKKLPGPIYKDFNYFVDDFKCEGLKAIKRMEWYRFHYLVGKRTGQCSASLSHGWRVIFKILKNDTIYILKITNHDYSF